LYVASDAASVLFLQCEDSFAVSRQPLQAVKLKTAIGTEAPWNKPQQEARLYSPKKIQVTPFEETKNTC